MPHAAQPSASLLLDPARFQGEIDGQAVNLFTLRNSRGMVAGITNYGARIAQLLVPDRHGRLDDVVLGYDSLAGFMGGAPSMGAFIGRYAGRIGDARFMLGRDEYLLGANNGKHCLHGGIKGSRFRVFAAVQLDASSVEMRYVFADGEEGFPGTLALRLLYSLGEANELVIDYQALALDKPTVASFTSHAFFNLNGESNGYALGHEAAIFADRYFAMSADLVATGELLPVEHTALDFRQPVVLDTRLHGNAGVAGYDSCYLINRSVAGGLALAARVGAPGNGRVMEVWSTEPAMQFYTGLLPTEALPGGPGKSGLVYYQQQGLCFEPQAYPNAPNCPAFPSSLHEPGQGRRGTTLYRFVA